MNSSASCSPLEKLTGDEVNRLKLTLSDKSIILSDNSATRSVAKQLNKIGISIGINKVGDDVGVQMAGGIARPASTLNNRIDGKGADSAKRTRELVAINPSAIKLVMSGVVPKQIYGHQAMGASILQMYKMRKTMKDSTAYAGTWA